MDSIETPECDARELSRAEIAEITLQQVPAPIDMVLHCPNCGMQHIDGPERNRTDLAQDEAWHNPPHRSHLCHGCDTIWRPADVPTNGVASIATRGKADTWPKAAVLAGLMLALTGCAAFGPPIDSRIKPYKPAITIEWRERTLCYEYLPDGKLRAWTCEVAPGQSVRPWSAPERLVP